MLRIGIHSTPTTRNGAFSSWSHRCRIQEIRVKGSPLSFTHIITISQISSYAVAQWINQHPCSWSIFPYHRHLFWFSQLLGKPRVARCVTASDSMGPFLSLLVEALFWNSEIWKPQEPAISVLDNKGVIINNNNTFFLMIIWILFHHLGDFSHHEWRRSRD